MTETQALTSSRSALQGGRGQWEFKDNNGWSVYNEQQQQFLNYVFGRYAGTPVVADMDVNSYIYMVVADRTRSTELTRQSDPEAIGVQMLSNVLECPNAFECHPGAGCRPEPGRRGVGETGRQG